MIVLQVRRIEACIDAVKQHGGSFVTPNGEPVRFSSELLAAAADDRPGSGRLFIELINPDQSPEAPEAR